MVRSSLVAIQLPLAREPSAVVRGEGVACFCGDCGKVWRQDGGADELSVTGNFKESVGIAMKGTICF